MTKQLNDAILERVSKLSQDEKDSLLVWLLRFYSVANGALKNFWMVFERAGDLITTLVEKDQASSDFTILLMDEINAEAEDIENQKFSDEYFDGLFPENGEENEDN